MLNSPGVYRLQDPRTRVYNFDPYLEKILPAEEFDFTRLDDFQYPSEDPELTKVAHQFNAKFLTSTSNMTYILGLFHFLLSWWRPLNFDMMSRGFGHISDSFTTTAKEPVSVFLRRSGDRYALEKDSEYNSGSDLMLAGHILEKLLTVPPHVFEQYRLSNPDTPTKTPESERPFHYSLFEDMLVRSQLDAYDPRLPGSGVFDIKTRAVLPIRMDVAGQLPFAKSYQLMSEHGEYESFERELIDMSRATMLKYSLQARLGNMDGIFVAYHNLTQLFGFQYVSIADMDLMLHGQEDRTLGDQELRASIKLLSEIFNRITERYPNQASHMLHKWQLGLT
jgi:Mitochondrial protein Pet127